MKTVTSGVPSAGMAVEGQGFSHAANSAQQKGFSPCGGDVESIRFSSPDSLDAYLAAEADKLHLCFPDEQRSKRLSF